MKVCITCNKEKEANDYYIADSNTGRRSNQCKTCKSEYNKTFEMKNKERRRKQKEIYWENTKDQIREKRTTYMNTKRKSDESFRIANNMRSILSYLVTGRQQTTSKDFGGPRDIIRMHLESQFVDGMSWANYGEWEIDHIVPVSSYDQTDKVQLSKCWHYSNIRPVWQKENRQKWKHAA